METPDITPMQVRATILWIVSSLALFGVSVSTETSNQLIALGTGLVTALPVILVYADAVIRKARSQNMTAIMQSKVELAVPAAPFIPSNE